MARKIYTEAELREMYPDFDEVVALLQKGIDLYNSLEPSIEGWITPEVLKSDCMILMGKTNLNLAYKLADGRTSSDKVADITNFMLKDDALYQRPTL